MDCPICGVTKPHSATRCNCGYDFGLHSIENPYLERRENATSADEGVRIVDISFRVKLWKRILSTSHLFQVMAFTLLLSLPYLSIHAVDVAGGVGTLLFVGPPALCCLAFAISRQFERWSKTTAVAVGSVGILLAGLTLVSLPRMSIPELGVAMVFCYALVSGPYALLRYRARFGINIHHGPPAAASHNVSGFSDAGVVILFVAAALADVGVCVFLLRGLLPDLGDWDEVYFLVTLLLIFLGLLRYRMVKRRRQLPAAELRKVDNRAPVLLLRSFADDMTVVPRLYQGWFSLLPFWFERATRRYFEEAITEELSDYGPVIAIGKPGEPLPPPGAAREYIEGNEWQSRVETLAHESQIIVLILAGTKGVLWETRNLVALGALSKVMLLVPPVRLEVELNQRWKVVRGALEDVGVSRLPADISARRIIAMTFRGVAVNSLLIARNREELSYREALAAAFSRVAIPG